MIELEDLNFSYPKAEQPLFDHLDLQVKAGTICGMLGPNGAGKSTLLKILAGLIFPQSGSCRINGFIPQQRHPNFLADIFLLPEELYVPPVTANQYQSRFAPFYPKFDYGVFAELLGEFELPSDRKLNKLSQGQKKKFLLAFGVATNTRLLIMDEPSNGLDIPSKSQFRRVLVSNFSKERTFIISTHQVHDLEGLIDSVIIISDGRILLNEELDFVGTRVAVHTEVRKPNDALYFEEGLEGFAVIRKNQSGLESRVDLNLLFGFVTRDNLRAQQILEGEAAHD